MQQRALHPAYQRIIGMGWAVVPLLLRELQRQPDHWLWALQAITGEEPARGTETLQAAAQAWLNWGQERAFCPMPRDDRERSFLRLAASGYRITSPASPAYNCAAWAAEESHRWWDPSSEEGYYWPPGLPRGQSLSALVAAFATLRYELCAHAQPEVGVEKLAIYADTNGWPTHVARQIPSGAWTSKLGPSEDIEHATLDALEGALYGKVVQYLRRVKAANEK